MKNEITLFDFILLIVELLVFFLLISKGGMTIYTQEEMQPIEGYVAEDIPVTPDSTAQTVQREYFELPYWMNEMKGSTNKFLGNLKGGMSNIRLTIYIFKSLILITITLWILFLIIKHSKFKGQNLEIQILIAVKHLLIWFFLLSGLISVLGNLDKDVFWDYGDITTLQKAGRYFSVKQLPLLLALLIGIISLIYIKFKKIDKPPPKKEHKIHH